MNRYRLILPLLWLFFTIVPACAQQHVLLSKVVCLDRGQTHRIEVKLQPLSRYRLSARLKTESGTDNVSIQLAGLGGNNISLSSAKANWTSVEGTFCVAAHQSNARIEVVFPEGQTGARAFVDSIVVSRIGDYKEPVYQGFPPAGQREVCEDMGVSMQPDSKIEWMLDAKLGMFIHWGLYAGPAQGEWYMENKGVPITDYRKLAYPVSGDRYFDACDFDARKWTSLARKAGFRYVNLTTQHHDGFALFASIYPNAFTSAVTHGRDFVREYVDACRADSLKVGFYKTLINWRYPGYYDVAGDNCKQNKFGYVTAPWHKDNARTMKEELYCQVRELMSNYGKIDKLFWDGGWLGQQGSDADAAYFWESGKWLSSDTPWPVDSAYMMKDPITGKALGLMGMVRELQPDIVVNPRCGWIGDYRCEEGGGEVKGPVRNGVVEKCMTISQAWGYTATAEDPSRIAPLSKIKRICADCMVRNMCFLVNVGPDRHGNIPAPVVERIEEFGQWVARNRLAIYGTRGGPWNPVDGQYGFTYKDNRIYVYFLGGFTSSSLDLPAMDKGLKALKVYRLEDGAMATLSQKGRKVTLNNLDVRKDDVTVYVIELNRNVR